MPQALKRPGLPSGAGLAQPLAKPEKLRSALAATGRRADISIH
jgi:hypothetical protein